MKRAYVKGEDNDIDRRKACSLTFLAGTLNQEHRGLCAELHHEPYLTLEPAHSVELTHEWSRH
jgi:hypothetical protein